MTHAALLDGSLPEGSLILDVGCATGRTTLELTRLGYRAVGVELDASLLGALRADTETSDLPACRGDARRLPLAEATADGAVIVEVLEHIPDPDGVLRELRRVMKPGGRLCVAVPTGYTEWVYDRLHPRYTSNAGHVNRFARADLATRLAAAGFAVEGVEVRNFGPALSWLVHSVIRTEADHTGRVLEHRWVDVAVAGGLWVLRRTPVARRLLRALESRVGKSRYFSCVAA